MVKVRIKYAFLKKGVRYELGSIHEVTEEDARAFGPSVEVLVPAKKEIEETGKKDKMLRSRKKDRASGYSTKEL